MGHSLERRPASLPSAIQATLAEVAETLAAVSAATTLKQRNALHQRACAGLVFAYWQAKFDHPRALLDRKREARIVARLRENEGDVGELLYVLDMAAKDPWTTGEDPKAGRPYDGIETIFRDRSQVERFAERSAAYRAGKPHPTAVKYLGATNGQTEG